MKILERIVDGLIGQLMSIDDSQFGFVPGRGTTDAIFVVRQLQEKYLAANKRLHGFHRPREGFWPSTLEGHLVGAEKTCCGGVDCTTSAGDVCRCVEPCPCWWGVQWRVWSEGRCSPRLSTQPASLHHCAWSFITRVPLWGPLGGPLCQWPCYHCRIARGMCQKALDLERSNGKERTEMQERRRSWSVVRAWTSCRVQRGSCAVCHTGVGSNSIFCNGCKHWVHKKCSGLKRLTKDPDYSCTRCQGTARPLDSRPQGSPSQTWQVGGGSFLLLPRRHALSSRYAVNFQPRHLWKPPGRSSRCCYQFSLHATSFSRHVAMCGAQCFMPVRLGHWQNQTANVCSWMTGQWSDRSAMSGRKTLSPPGPLNFLCCLALRIWTSFWRREGCPGMGIWNAPMVQSRQPFTYRLRERVGLGGPRWHGNS